MLKLTSNKNIIALTKAIALFTEQVLRITIFINDEVTA
jgi:hypothetical protein